MDKQEQHELELGSAELARAADDTAHAPADEALEVVEDAVDVVVDDQPVNENDQRHRPLQLVDVEDEEDFRDDQRVFVDALGLGPISSAFAAKAELKLWPGGPRTFFFFLSMCLKKKAMSASKME